MRPVYMDGSSPRESSETSKPTWGTKGPAMAHLRSVSPRVFVTFRFSPLDPVRVFASFDRSGANFYYAETQSVDGGFGI